MGGRGYEFRSPEATSVVAALDKHFHSNGKKVKGKERSYLYTSGDQSSYPSQQGANSLPEC